MTDYDVIIIGAGIGGLTCGALLAKHGMNVLICEQHDKPGGYCTSYKRGGYRFDIPDVAGGLRPGTNLAELFTYLNLDRRISWVEEKRLFRHIFPDLTIDCPTDIDHYQDNLASAFPHERRGIAAYLAEARATWAEVMESYYHASPLQLLSYPLRFPRLVRYRNQTHLQFARRFVTDPRLVEVLGAGWRFLGVAGDQASALVMVELTMSYATGGAWYPVGGYQGVADAFADALGSFGGELRCRTRVSNIVLRSGQAVGVRLSDGTVLRARNVVSNADARATFLTLLDGKNIPGRLAGKARSLRPSATGIVLHIAARISIPMELDCASVTYNHRYGAVPDAFDDSVAHRLCLEPDSLSFALTASTKRDPGLAEHGQSVIGVAVMPVPGAGAAVWATSDRDAYRAQKKHLSNTVLAATEKVLPGIGENVLAMDLNTPVTYQRYTGATEGCWYDAAAIPQQSALRRWPAATGIRGLFLTGAKTCPGHGIYGAVHAALFAADTVTRGALTRGRVPLAPRS